MENQTPTHIKAHEILFGTEYNGSTLPDLCAPLEQLDYHSGVFEHKGDAYYNPGPWPKSEENHKWTMLRRGVHVTQDLSDIEELLHVPHKDRSGNVILTDRCVEQLVNLGYRVVVRTVRITTITQTLVVDNTFANSLNKQTSIVEDSLTLKETLMGKKLSK